MCRQAYGSPGPAMSAHSALEALTTLRAWSTGIVRLRGSGLSLGLTGDPDYRTSRSLVSFTVAA